MISDTENKIKTLIIDDDEESLFTLQEHLSFFPEIELEGSASKYRNIKNLFKKDRIDLLFLDVEMPVKNGFELLHEIRGENKSNFRVIFYTAYDQYVIRALRESALDYILKPVTREDLKNAIERFKSQRKLSPTIDIPHSKYSLSEIISLPAPTGIKFLDKNDILLFQCVGTKFFEKKYWISILTDRSQIKLRTGTSAKDILGFVGTSKFMRLNQSFIVNINYLSDIEYKTRECHLVPPFDDITIIASRANVTEIRENFDLL
jgi:two-component system LytT family response regulator